MSAPDADDGPVQVAADLGWADGFTGRDPRSSGDFTEREWRAYQDLYALGREERDGRSGAYCPDCDGVHRPGECPLVTIRRDPWWIRLVAWSWHR